MFSIFSKLKLRKDMLLKKNLKSGKNYRDYYRDKIRRKLSKDPDWKLEQEQKTHIDFLLVQGLKKEHKLLEFGCNALNAGIHIMKYLNTSNYTGIDVVPELLEIGKKRISVNELWDKKPRLICTKPNDFSHFDNEYFDVIWCLSVLTHLPPEEIEFILTNFKKILKKDGRIYANFILGSKVEQKNFISYEYNKQYLTELSNRLDLQMEIIEDWHSIPRKYDESIFLCFTSK